MRSEEAMLWARERSGIRCQLCAKNCFIAVGKKGACSERENKENKLYSNNFGKIIAMKTEKVEKKLLFHFLPGSSTLSFSCRVGEDWAIEHEDPKVEKEKEFSPEEVIELAEQKNCKTISYCFFEPTIYFEFLFKTAKLAHRSNIKNVFVTNGYATEEAIKKVAKHLDAAVVNFKASASPEFMKKFMIIPSVEPIYDGLKQLKKQRVFIEITNLIIPQIGESSELNTKLSEWISDQLGSDIPYHILQFHPNKKFPDVPSTPVPVLEKFLEESRRSGLRYVYLGRLPKHIEESTFCYNCREKLIERSGSEIVKINLIKDRCPNCGSKINVVAE